MRVGLRATEMEESAGTGAGREDGAAHVEASTATRPTRVGSTRSRAHRRETPLGEGLTARDARGWRWDAPPPPMRRIRSTA